MLLIHAQEIAILLPTAIFIVSVRFLTPQSLEKRRKRSLLLNLLSPRYEQMKDSSLTKKFDTAVIDPIKLEKEGRAFIVTGDLDRTDKKQFLSIFEKYQSENIAEISMTYLSGTFVIPTKTE